MARLHGSLGYALEGLPAFVLTVLTVTFGLAGALWLAVLACFGKGPFGGYYGKARRE